jgi:hypothetical protein
MEEKELLNKPKPFNFQYSKKNGELETYHNPTLNSIYSMSDK